MLLTLSDAFCSASPAVPRGRTGFRLVHPYFHSARVVYSCSGLFVTSPRQGDVGDDHSDSEVFPATPDYSFGKSSQPSTTVATPSASHTIAATRRPSSAKAVSNSTLSSIDPCGDVDIRRFQFKQHQQQQQQQQEQRKPRWSTALHTDSHSSINKQNRNPSLLHASRSSTTADLMPDTLVGLKISDKHSVNAGSHQGQIPIPESIDNRVVANVAAYDTSFEFGTGYVYVAPLFPCCLCSVIWVCAGL
jgi:hypothetical protein